MIPFRLLLSVILLFSVAVHASSLAAQHARYEIGGFDRVYFSGSGTLRLTQGNAPALVAQAEREVLEGLVVEIHDGALFIESAAVGSERLVIDLTLEDLRELVSDGHSRVVGDSLRLDHVALEGKGDSAIRLDGLRAEEISVTGHDSAQFMLSGRVDRQVLELQGAPRYSGWNLLSRFVEARVQGMSTAAFSVEHLLDVSVDDAARVRYSGSPYVSQRVSGAGSVTQVRGHSI